MDNAFDYVQQNDGIDTETYYPYQAQVYEQNSYKKKLSIFFFWMYISSI